MIKVSNDVISVKVIEHSVFDNQELITIETKAPKFLDAEIEKHRMISSNSSSDRAIPVNKMIEADYFLPMDVRKNQSGMQGENILDDKTKNDFRHELEYLRSVICDLMEKWSVTYNIHKQHVNRYILPFSIQTKVMTANKDQWNYFLSLRLHEAADPAIYDLAFKINDAINHSNPKQLNLGEWHLPYIKNKEKEQNSNEDLCKMSSARCARTSYNNHDGSSPNKEKDFKLFSFLINEDLPHATPTEHQATPMSKDCTIDHIGVSHIDKYDKLWSGNFHSFIQFRKMLEDKSWEVENSIK